MPKLIIPMAGRGTRLRPHTLTVPKPLVKIAGKSMVERLAEDIAAVYGNRFDEIAFIIGDFGVETERSLLALAERLGAKGKIYYQEQQLGTGHAIRCAADSLKGDVVIAFADTLFRVDNMAKQSPADATLWVQKVPNPAAYGVVTLDQAGFVEGFVEKPQTFVSDLAIIGIYYFKSGESLLEELDYLIDHDIQVKGEYQLTDALENMRKKGLRFDTLVVDEWLDCGNKQALLHANARVLSFSDKNRKVASDAKLINTTIIEPCHIGPGVEISNSVVGPNVSIGENSKIENSVVKDSIVQEFSKVNNLVLGNSIIGSHAEAAGIARDLNVGDYNTLNI
jgi:glucose-1-phosphate thymidylyltransferase